MSNDVSGVYYLDASCAASDFVYLATQLESLDPAEAWHTRMSILDLSDPDTPWAYHDYEDNIVSVHAYRGDIEDLPDGSRFVALGRHGTVRFNQRNEPTFVEQISEAGMVEGRFGGLMSNLRQIDGQLWACGQHGQVYRRFGRDDWRRADAGIRVDVNPAAYAGNVEQMLEKISTAPMLNCIDGTSGNDVYVVGMQGFMAHFDGTQWTEMALPVDEHLEWVRCYGPEEVLVCGHNGTLLKGNSRSGFKSVSGIDDHQTFVCVAKFNDKVYLSAEEGLFLWDGKKIASVKTKLKPELQDAWRLDQADGYLWSVGVSDMARFDGKTWERIQHPDNEMIGE